MTPNEQKAYEWEKQFDKRFNKPLREDLPMLRQIDNGKLYMDYSDIKDFIASQIAQARTDERRRIGEIVKGMKEDTTYCGSWCDCSAHGYNKALSDIIFLINKE
jgi:hypothetical protein